MPTYHIHLPHPRRARGPDPAYSFTSVGAAGYAEELQAALAGDALFRRWRDAQAAPDEVDPALGRCDPAARVRGVQKEERIELAATTELGGDVLRHRMGLLAGPDWQLRDVSASR